MAHDPNDPALFKQLSSELAALMSKFLTENHGFAAFAGGITTSGEIVYLANDSEGADPQEELQRLARELANPKWHVGVIFVDTRVTPPGPIHVSRVTRWRPGCTSAFVRSHDSCALAQA